MNYIMRSFVICTLRIIKSRRMRWARRVARIWEKRNAYRLMVGKPEGNLCEDQDVGRWIILKWMLER
jgi:hypothetical protein